MATKRRAYYIELFQEYPDVVKLPDLCRMLGGVAETTVRKLLRANHIKHFNLPHHNGAQYMIPKEYIIDYVLSDHYAEYKKSLKAQI